MSSPLAILQAVFHHHGYVLRQLGEVLSGTVIAESFRLLLCPPESPVDKC